MIYRKGDLIRVVKYGQKISVGTDVADQFSQLDWMTIIEKRDRLTDIDIDPKLVGRLAYVSQAQKGYYRLDLYDRTYRFFPDQMELIREAPILFGNSCIIT
jgi:hypothetical protein